MKWENYHLDTAVFKTVDKITLWKNEKGIVDIAKDTLTIKVLLDDKPCGYVFHGKGILLLDTIIETEKGAIGNSIEKTLDKAFLMIGRSEETQQQLTETKNEDFTKNYQNQQQFIETAQHLLDKFFDKYENRHKHSKTLNTIGGLIFAFQNYADKMDILVVKDSKLVYTSSDKVFVSKGEKVVLTNNENVVVSNHGKSIIIERNCCSGMRMHKGDYENLLKRHRN